MSSLTKEKPLACIPLDGIPKTTSFSFTLLLSNIFFLETIQTLKAAKSN